MSNNSVQSSKTDMKEGKKNTNGTSILLRLSPSVAEEVRRTAKKEERTITTVVTRAIKQYIKNEYQIEINDNDD